MRWCVKTKHSFWSFKKVIRSSNVWIKCWVSIEEVCLWYKKVFRFYSYLICFHLEHINAALTLSSPSGRVSSTCKFASFSDIGAISLNKDSRRRRLRLMMSLRHKGPAVISLLADISQGGLAKRETAYIVYNGFYPQAHTEQDMEAKKNTFKVSRTRKVSCLLCCLGG